MTNLDLSFDSPVPLPDGQQTLDTVHDALGYIRALTNKQTRTGAWMLAAKEVQHAARDPQWRFFARLALMHALYPEAPKSKHLSKAEKQDAWRERRRAWKTSATG